MPVISRRALLSTSNKAGLAEFALSLIDLKFTLLATGGTAKLLQQHHIPVTDIADYTGFPEIMNGRVKTLHPKIYGGLLGRRGIDDATMAEHDIPPIDLVAVNLYPFQSTIADPATTNEQAIEQIDIGGPSMLRAAAKNFKAVTVIVDPDDYPRIIDELKQHNSTQLSTRQQLASKVFNHTAQYDAAIAHYFQQQTPTEPLPDNLTLNFKKQQNCRYGENPHQAAAVYVPTIPKPGSLANATLLQGKPLSFNNLADSDAALNCVRALNPERAGCVIVKHATPCGAAQADNLTDAYLRAYATDMTSAFGGIIAFNRSLDEATAKIIVAEQFCEVILAPDISPAALAILNSKPNCRVLAVGQHTIDQNTLCLQSMDGGLLVQQADQPPLLTQDDFKIVSQRQPYPSEIVDCLFAWQVVTFVKSNAIVYARNQATIGIGTGQTSRVFSVTIAALKAQLAGLDTDQNVMASDAFFPFADSIDIAAAAGITAIIQPGGSKRDAEVIAAADKANIAMLLTGTRHFRH